MVRPKRLLVREVDASMVIHLDEDHMTLDAKIERVINMYHRVFWSR